MNRSIFILFTILFYRFKRVLSKKSTRQGCTLNLLDALSAVQMTSDSLFWALSPIRYRSSSRDQVKYTALYFM